MEVDKWRIETAERLASIESSIKYIESNISRLPPSPACVEKHVEFDQRLEDLEEFKKYILMRIAWVSGAFAVLVSGLFSSFDLIKGFFKLH